jgi:hypothetical protein
MRSPIALPELLAAGPEPEPPDVTVRRGSVDREFVQVDDRGRAFFSASDGEACYFYKNSGKYLVREGREIIVDPTPGAPEMLVRLSLIGPALGLVLIQRGFFLLHASAVAIEGHGVAFLGGYAYGKSTIAASLHALGHRLLSDDLTALQLEEAAKPMVIPSFPHLKLWPDAVSSLGRPAEELPRVHPELEKRRLRVNDRFDVTAVALERLFVLSKGPTVTVQHVEPESAVTELLGHWYGARFGPELLQSMDVPEHFLRCTRLAQNVPLLKLQRPVAENPTDPEFARAIESAVRCELDI